MTAFDLFQRATCEIMEGDRADAIATLDAAIAQIDADGNDADMRMDIAALRETVANSIT